MVGIVVHDLDFSGFHLVEDGDRAPLPEAGGLWDRMIRRLLAGGQLAGRAVGRPGTPRGAAPAVCSPPCSASPAPPPGPWAPDAGDAALAAAAADFVERPDAETGAAIGLLWQTVDPPRRVRLAAALADAIESAPGAGAGSEQLLAALPDGAGGGGS